MTRKLQAGSIPGATKDDQGNWQVPLSGLLAAGLHPDRPTLPEDVEPPHDNHDGDQALTIELAELRGQLALEKARREAAEAISTERAARIEDLRLALRAISPPDRPQTSEPTHPAQDPQPEPFTPGVTDRFRRWWRGR